MDNSTINLDGKLAGDNNASSSDNNVITDDNNISQVDNKEVAKGFTNWLNSLFNGEKFEEKTEVKEKEKENNLKDPDNSKDISFEERLKLEKEKWEAEKQKEKELEKLPEDEKLKLKEKEKDDEIKSLKSKLLKKELKDKAIESFSSEGYPVKLAELLNYEDEEKMNESMKNVTDIFKNCLAEAVDKRLRRKTPDGIAPYDNKDVSIEKEIEKAINGGI